MESNTNIENQVAIIENSVEVLKTGGEILKANQLRSSKAISVGRNLLAAIKENGMTPELDMKAMEYMGKINVAGKQLKESRAEVTQIMDELKKMFTQVENDIDPKKAGTVPSLVQAERDQYAKDCALAEKKKREEAERVAAKAKEASEIKAHALVALNSFFQNYLLGIKSKMLERFNACTLDTLQEFETMLRAYQPEYKADHFQKFSFHQGCSYHAPDEFLVIVNSVKTEEHYTKFSFEYKSAMAALTQELIDKVPSKNNELLEEKRQAEEAAKLREKARLEEEARQRQMKLAGEKERKRLEEEGRIAQEKEAQRLKEQKAQQAKVDEEKRQREQAEAAQLNKEAEEARIKAEQEAELQKQGEQTMIMFDKEASISESAPAPEVRQGYDITVQHAAGFVQIFQFWFENEGKSLPLDKIGKTSLDQMKAFCEKTAHKNGTKIESKFITYEPSYKAVNRKEAK